MKVAYDLDVLEHDQPSLDQLLERGQKHLDSFLLFEDLDPLGQIFRQAQQVRLVDAGRLADSSGIDSTVACLCGRSRLRLLSSLTGTYRSLSV